MTPSPAARVLADVRRQWRVRGRLPPGPTSFSLRRTHEMSQRPLPLLLRYYEQYGPVFTVRVFHDQHVFMLGPQANHYITVSHAASFGYRGGEFAELMPLVGDGLLTTDGARHDHARARLMPAFHRLRTEAAVPVIEEETRRAMADWRPGTRIDLYRWSRELTIRIALRVLLGLDADRDGEGAAAARHFERALSFYAADMPLWLLRGPGTPWRRLLAARRALDTIILRAIRERRRAPRPAAQDVLSALVTPGGDDRSLSDQEVRDQLVTLLFAGHDTSASTITFLFHELARAPHVAARLRAEQDAGPGDGPSELEMAVDETLRLYPPAWVGPRIALEGFEFAGRHIPAGMPVAYCSWASHRLAHVFPDPEAFVPERFTRERRAALPKGAYVPFGGGPRICIGKRMGQTQVRVVAALVLQRFALELMPGYALSVRQMPTLSPRHAMPMTVRER